MKKVWTKLLLVNGGWGDWTSWSSCGDDCKNTRSRYCDSPAPGNGGSDCSGDSKESKKCCPDPMIITWNHEADVSDWPSDVIKVMAIGGGSAGVS